MSPGNMPVSQQGKICGSPLPGIVRTNRQMGAAFNKPELEVATGPHWINNSKSWGIEPGGAGRKLRLNRSAPSLKCGSPGNYRFGGAGQVGPESHNPPSPGPPRGAAKANIGTPGQAAGQNKETEAMQEVMVVRDSHDSDMVHVYAQPKKMVYISTVHMDMVELLFGGNIAEILLDGDGVTPEWIEVSARILALGEEAA